MIKTFEEWVKDNYIELNAIDEEGDDFPINIEEQLIRAYQAGVHEAKNHYEEEAIATHEYYDKAFKDFRAEMEKEADKLGVKYD